MRGPAPLQGCGAQVHGGSVGRVGVWWGAPGVLPCAVPVDRAYAPSGSLSPESVLTCRDRLITLFVSDSPRGDGEGSTTGALDGYLREKGLLLGKDVIVDPLSAPPLYPVVRSYGAHPIVESFENAISIFPLARAVERASVSEA